MKVYSIIVFLLLSSWTLGQAVPHKIMAKIKPEFKGYFKQNLVTHPDLIGLFEKQIDQTLHKWPNHSLPRNVSNEWVDLSLIFEFTVNGRYSTGKVINQLSSSGIFEYVEPKYNAFIVDSPNDPELNLQFYLTQIEAIAAWDIWQGDANTVVAIIDTGSDMDHPDLMDNMVERSEEPQDGIDNDNNGKIDDYTGWDFVDNDNYPNADVNDHGVHVAGLSSASTNNATGVAGSGYNCSLLTVRAGENNNISYGYEGLVYAADAGADVINCSWGSPNFSNFAADIVRYATLNKDALVVAAAGNNGAEIDFYPAAYDYALSVTSVDDNDSRSGFSNYGYWIDITAPGAGLYNTINDGEYGTKVGTSMASPLVAGAAALVRSKYPNFTALQTKEHLKSTAFSNFQGNLNVGFENKLGSGRLNMYQALNNPLTQPAIDANRINVTDNGDNVFLIGDTLDITAFFTNYLARAENLVAQISVIEGQNALQIIDPQFTLGSLDTYEYKSNSNDPFQVVITPSAAVNETVVIGISSFNSSYSTTDFLSIDVNVDYQNIESKNLALTINSSSRLGYSRKDQQGGIGLRYKESRTLLYEGGFMVGNISAGEIDVSDAVRNSPGGADSDFSELTPVRQQSLMSNEYQRLSTSFTDTLSLADKVGLSVSTDAYSIDLEGHEDYIILEYDVTNITADAKNNLAAGIFTDFDIAAYDNNKAYTDFQRYLVFTEYTGGRAPVAGVQLLYPSNFNVYCIDNVNGASNGINMFDTFDSGEKYTTLTEWRTGAGDLFDLGNDVVHICASDYGNLPPGSTAKFVFAIHAAEDISSLQASADSAYKYFNGNLPTSTEELSTSESEVNISPNPTRGIITLSSTDLPERIEVFSINGELVQEFKNGSYKQNIELPAEKGMYLIKIFTSTSVYLRKVIRY